MLCNSSNSSPPAPRRAKGLARMTAVARERILVDDCVAEADFLRAGFSRADIAEHGEAAIAAAHRLIRAAAH